MGEPTAIGSEGGNRCEQLMRDADAKLKESERLSKEARDLGYKGKDVHLQAEQVSYILDFFSYVASGFQKSEKIELWKQASALYESSGKLSKEAARFASDAGSLYAQARTCSEKSE